MSNVNLGSCDFHSCDLVHVTSGTVGFPTCEDLHTASHTCKYSINFQSIVSFYEAKHLTPPSRFLGIWLTSRQMSHMLITNSPKGHGK